MRGLGRIVVAAVALGAGCGESYDRGDVSVALDAVPPGAMKAAREKLPDVRFDAAWKETRDGKESFEIRGHTDRGKIRDVKVTAAGEVLEVD